MASRPFSIEEVFSYKPSRRRRLVMWFKYGPGSVGRYYYRVKYGVRNLVRWFPIIWHDQDWDQVYLLRLMEEKTKQMAILHEVHGHTLSAPRTARQLRTVSLLCKRLREDHYYIRLSENFKHRSNLYKMADSIAKQDAELLGKLIARHIREWWD